MTKLAEAATKYIRAKEVESAVLEGDFVKAAQLDPKLDQMLGKIAMEIEKANSSEKPLTGGKAHPAQMSGNTASSSEMKAPAASEEPLTGGKAEPKKMS